MAWGSIDPRNSIRPKNVDGVTILSHRAPKILALTPDGDEDFVQVPRVTETTLSTLQPASVFRAELDAPKSDGFVGNRDAALGQ